MKQKIKLLIESLYKEYFNHLNEKFGSNAFTDLINTCKSKVKPGYTGSVRVFYYNAPLSSWCPIAFIRLNHKGKLDLGLQSIYSDNFEINAFKFFASLKEENIYENKCFKEEELQKYNVNTADDFCAFLNKQKVNNIGIFAVIDNGHGFSIDVQTSKYNKELFETLKKSKIIASIIIKNDEKINELFNKFNQKIEQRKINNTIPSEFITINKNFQKHIDFDNDKKMKLLKKLTDLNYYQESINKCENYYAKKYSPELCKQLHNIIVEISKKSDFLNIYKELESLWYKENNVEFTRTDEKCKSHLRYLLWTFITDNQGQSWMQKDKFTGVTYFTENLLFKFLNNYYPWWKNFYFTYNPTGILKEYFK